uniref:Phosphomevalonate kinase n=1 Tax=Lynceus sp. MCZ IZ 141354 TaxID=1930659 RepID=A0A9N6WUI5_9CRUS|nr:EOG090X0FYC [Lynceus sp. MCZ IZ 141354]
MSANPEVVVFFSGKRKSGKDYVIEKLLKRLDEKQVAIVRLSAPIKLHWARTKGLSFEQLLDNTPYKENFRLEMIEWSEHQRFQNPSVFCDAAIELSEAFKKPIWLVPDGRRKTDLEYFQNKFPGRLRCLRITASEETRKARGWSFTEGVDDAPSECGLDAVLDHEWDLINCDINSSISCNYWQNT